MTLTVVGFMVAAIALYVIASLFNPTGARQGLEASYRMVIDPDVGLIPLIVAAILIAGIVQTVVPKELIANYLGEKAGFRGILLGTLLGGITPGGPYVAFPLVGELYRAGASVGTVMAYVAAWSLLAFTRLPLELPFLGTRLVSIRLAASVAFPLIIGYIAQFIYETTKLKQLMSVSLGSPSRERAILDAEI